MSQAFDAIVIIYNPNSTGDSKSNALQLQSDLLKNDDQAPVILRETTHAGHAEEMAKEYAKSTQSMLLISSSGDGGYHELINGVLLSNAQDIVVGLLPSGNANDHHGAVADGDIVHHILQHTTKRIDVIKVSSTCDGQPWVRYAHSYVGIGLSPIIGQQLTKSDLNWFNEKWLLIKYLFKYTHATIRVDGKKKRFSSLVFSNIDQMSKVIKLAKTGSINDGKFEVSSISYRSKLAVLALLAKSATFGLEELGSFESYSFTTTRRLLVQLDGEIYKLDSDSKVSISCIGHGLVTVL